MSTALAEIDAPPELKTQVSACVEWSENNAIATADDYTRTADHLKVIKRSQKAADEFFDPPIAQAFQLHKMLCQRKRVVTDPLVLSERTDKSKLAEFDAAERAKAEAERRRLQQIACEQARKEREKAEQAASRQRAIEYEARAKAEAARREAEAASAEERKRLLAEAEVSERVAAKAAAKVEVAEDKAAAVVTPVIAVASVAPKTAGVSTRTTWKAVVTDLPAFLAFVCSAGRHDLITPNQAVLDALAKGLREAASMPGVTFSPVTTMSASSR